MRMKNEMEKSFKLLSAGRAAGIKEVQKDVLGVTDEESDSLMDNLITDAVSTPEDDASAASETPPKDDKVKVIIKTK